MDNTLCTFCLTLAVEPIELKCHHLICHGCSELTDICYYCKSLDKNISRSNSPRFQQPQSTTRGPQTKVIQKSIQFLENQAVYMTQFIEMQISSLIQCLKDRQTQLLAQLHVHITKKINFYQNASQANLKVEEYNDDKFMDFTNLKILTEEIQKFGKPTSKLNKQKKENQILHDVKLNQQKPQKKVVQVKQQKVQFRQQSNMTMQSKQSTYDENTHRMSFDDRSIDYKLSI